MDTNKLCGYAGKILRINLTNQTTEIVPTSKYVPEYIGGTAVGYKIFWDEVGPGVKAFDPENKIIYMTGPTAASGLSCGGRSTFVSIAPNSLPEQVAWSGIGGQVAAKTKFAGYDGFIIEGKAAEHTYLFINDDQIEFLSAEPLWGKLVHETQDWIKATHGMDVESMVIGPAGENLVRIASVTTSNDNAAAKAGLGAVFGSKNLKAIAIRGTGEIRPGDIDKVLYLRDHVAGCRKIPNPVVTSETPDYIPKFGEEPISVEGGVTSGRVACSYGCSMRCNRIYLNNKSVFDGKDVAQIEKCISVYGYNMSNDVVYMPMQSYHTEKNNLPFSQYCSYYDTTTRFDVTDPYMPELTKLLIGDQYNWMKPSWDRGNLVNQYCNEYGIDKWDIWVWYLTWLSMAGKEGLLEDLDFGMEPDLENLDFVKHFLDMLVYRKGIGDLFAEGMARALRKLGKEKYGDSIYHGRFSNALGGQRLDIPVSLEACWGQSAHWLGRGWQGWPKAGWMLANLQFMLSTRDSSANGHLHEKLENFLEYRDDPAHSEKLIQTVIDHEVASILKDSVVCCDWVSPNPFWPEMESEIFSAATGIATSPEELYTAAQRAKLLFRAILIRNYGRDRELEVNESYPFLTYPDPEGKTCTWDEWNDFVDLYYKKRNWDLQTGWPTREAWEAVGLSDVAEEMEKLGKLPPSGRTEYTRSPNPIGR